MSAKSPRILLRCIAAVVAGFALLCSAVWGEAPVSSPRVLTAQWQQQFSAQLTGLDLTWAGQTVALSVAPFTTDGESYVHVYDLTGRELWTAERRRKILSVSLSYDGQYTAVGLTDFSIAFFAKDGELLWERKSVGIPALSPPGNTVVAFNVGIASPPNLFGNPLLEVFPQDGNKSWSLHRKGRVWRSIVSDQSDLLVGLWSDEVLLIDRHYRTTWQRLLPKEIMALAISPQDAQYFAIGVGVLKPIVYFYERTGRLVWERELPLGVTDLSLARQGEFLLSYGNTIRGQHLALYRRSGEMEWTYHLEAPATESSKAVIVPDYPLIVAGIQRDERYYLQGFALTGRLLWIAPLPEPIFDFRVSRDGRYIAAATERTLFFFDTQPVNGPKAELQQ
jgi:outer membrane protein assembly factor BamB